PFHCPVIHTNGNNIHVIEKRQTICPYPRLRLVPLAMRHIHPSVWTRLIPHLTPASAHEQNITLLDFHLLRFGRVLEIFETDPVTAWERILPLVFGDIEQYATPNHKLDARRIAVHCVI